ncbi:MAG: exodeoxyribonuclease VII large subunit [Bacilli bacterium]
MKNEYLKVSDINKYIKIIIEDNPFLNEIYIKGEISNLKFHTRGHLYFSLKDDKSKINAIMFNYKNSMINFVPKDGDSVLIRGKVSVYEASGAYQVYVEEMNLDGKGDLYRLFEELKQKLYNEGLFDESHKKKIPKIPKTVGIITASTGAAVKDITSTINRRFPLVKMYLFPSLVQGAGAKESLVNMLKLADTYNLDVIIIGRGGGSIEDLWAFNEEIVARAIYNTKTPIVSAVGHEIDYTICDFVADKRAATPTGAAEMIVPDKDTLYTYLSDTKVRCNNSINSKIKDYKKELNNYFTNHLLSNPKNIYIEYEQRLDNIFDKLNFSIKNIIDKYKYILNNYNIILIHNTPNNLYIKHTESINNYKARLTYSLENIIKKYNYILKNYSQSLILTNPNNILKKGYALIYKNNKILNDNDKINVGDSLIINTSNKIMDASISKITNKKEE